MTRFIVLLSFFLPVVTFSIPYAEDDSTKKIVTAYAALKHGHSYSCVQCDEELILRQGEVKAPHFAHKRDPESTCTGGGLESIEHRYAKELLQENLGAWEFQVPCKKCSQPAQKLRFTRENGFRAELEHSFAPYRIDVGVLTGHRLAKALEVRHTHAVDDEKKDYLEANNITLVEVKASSVISAAKKKTFVVKTLHRSLCKTCERKEALRDFRPCLDCDNWQRLDNLSITMRPFGHRYSHAYVCARCKDKCPNCSVTMTKKQKEKYERCSNCTDQKINSEQVAAYAIQRKDLGTLRRMQATIAPGMCDVDIDGAIKAIEEEERILEIERNSRKCCECKTKHNIKELNVIKSPLGMLFAKYICDNCFSHCPS